METVLHSTSAKWSVLAGIILGFHAANKWQGSQKIVSTHSYSSAIAASVKIKKKKKKHTVVTNSTRRMLYGFNVSYATTYVFRSDG